MGSETLKTRATRRIRRILGEPDPEEVQRRYRTRITAKADIAARASQARSEMEKLFYAGGRSIQKWVHYLEIYERYFARYQGVPVKMLEIGVNHGGSLDMWRSYFGRDAVIFGVDINPDCAGRVTAPNQVRIGSQDDPKFLQAVVAEMGAPDIILDDGSHVGRHQLASFEILFPCLKPGGLYVIEDLCTSYWPGVWRGSYKRADTGIGLVKRLIDDMHAWYHNAPTTTPAKEEIGAIHMHNGIVVLEKVAPWRPSDVIVG